MSKKVPKCFSYKFKETKSLHSAFHHQNPHKSRRRVSVRGHAQHVLSLCYLCSPPWACLSRASKSRSSNWSWEGDGSASLLASERRKQIHRISKGEEETQQIWNEGPGWKLPPHQSSGLFGFTRGASGENWLPSFLCDGLSSYGHTCHT